MFLRGTLRFQISHSFSCLAISSAVFTISTATKFHGTAETHEMSAESSDIQLTYHQALPSEKVIELPSQLQCPENNHPQNGQNPQVEGLAEPSSHSVVPPPPCVRFVSIPDAPPPAYDSIFGKVKQIESESEGKASCALQVCEWICSTVCCMVCLGPALAVPIFFLVYGALHFHECPFEPKIPVYLVVTGGLAILHFIIILLKMCIKKIVSRNDPKRPEGGPVETAAVRSSEQEKIKHPTPKPVRYMEIILSIFSFTWFVVGCVYTYRTHRLLPTDTPISTLDVTWCMPQLFLTAFWFINSLFMLFGVSCALVTCVGCSCK